jgi:hypothetical protein
MSSWRVNNAAAFMSYELRNGESLGEDLRRICRKQVELALAIATGEAAPDDTPVHDTRRHLKKARAALRLVKKAISPDLFKRQDHCLRDVGMLDLRDPPSVPAGDTPASTVSAVPAGDTPPSTVLRSQASRTNRHE